MNDYKNDELVEVFAEQCNVPITKNIMNNNNMDDIFRWHTSQWHICPKCNGKGYIEKRMFNVSF